MKTTALLIAHGSRADVANREVVEMAARMERRLGNRVIACFLEIAAPSIPEGFAQAVEEGADRVVAVPFFLGTGAHVGTDIPRILAECGAERPHVEVVLTPALGPDPALDEIALDRIVRAEPAAVLLPISRG